MEKSDEQLIADYLSGDGTAFAALVSRHLKGVYSFAARSFRIEAEDIVQDTFVKAWQNLSRYDPGTAKFKTWLMRIARNTIIDHLRKKRPALFSDLENEPGGSGIEDAPDTGDLPDLLADRARNADRVEEAIEKLPLPYREVILLRYMSEMSLEEIAHVLREPASTIRSRHRRGLSQLRQLLGDLHRNGS